MCGFNNAKISSGNYLSDNFNSINEFEITNGSLIEVEVDLNKKIVYYFINEKLCPYYVYDIFSFPLLFGISCFFSNGIFEVISVQKLKQPSVYVSNKYKKIPWMQ
jgi:hypothetical protein